MTDWIMIDAEVDPPDAPFPKQLPAPADAPELATGELSQDLLGEWAERFARERPDDPLVPGLAFVRAIFHANAGAAYEQDGKTSDAIEAYTRALELAPGDAFVVDRLVDLGVLVEVESEDGEPLYMETGAVAEGVRQDLAQNADDPDYLATTAEGLLDVGLDDLARSAAELALTARPDHEAALLFAGIATARTGDAAKAAQLLERHVAAVPGSAMGHVHLAHVRHVLGDRTAAMLAARRALALDPNAVAALEVLVAGDDGPAGALERLHGLDDDLRRSWAAHRVEGDLLTVLGRHDEAVDALREAIARGGDDTVLSSLLAALGSQERFDELCDIADTITQLSERDPGVRWNVASGYAAGGREAEARIVFAQLANDDRVAPTLRAQAQQRVDEL